MPEFSDMFAGSMENLKKRTLESVTHLDTVTDDKSVPPSTLLLFHDLVFVNRFQQITIERLLIELDDMHRDIKQLQSRVK